MKGWARLGGALGVVIACGVSVRAAPCRHEVEWRLPAEVARVPGALETVAALAVWGPTPDHDWEQALARADEDAITTTIAVDGRRVRLALEGRDAEACASAATLVEARRAARWGPPELERARSWPLDRLEPTRRIREQAIAARAALGPGEAAPLPAVIVAGARADDRDPASRPGRRTEDAPADTDGRARLALAWAVEPADLAIATAAAADLAHPGGPLVSRLTGSHGAADRVSVHVTTLPPAIVVVAVTRDPRAARDRVLRELESFEIDPRPAALQAYAAARDAAVLERFVRRLARLPGSEVVQVAPDGAASALADAEDVMLFLRASIDLRCPAPGETRSSTELLEQKHGLDAARFLALSRALGRDPERFQGIDLEIRDRCAERAKLARLMPPGRVVSLYRAVRCLTVTDAAQRARAEATAFRRHDLDPSALGPLVALVREEPRWTKAIEDIERACPLDAAADGARGGAR
ncbi:MAG: hypothetical protein IT385_18710 [Deltaproteobacteria bacterium]|nr:hypothetical protein [Deltaproteobacteria bacterium]